MIILFAILSILSAVPTDAQETTRQENHIASITRIVRHVAKGVISPDQETLTPEQETLITQISQELIQEAEIVQAEQAQMANNRFERKEFIKTIVMNVAKGIAIIIALLVLRAIIGAIGRGTVVESPDTPLGIIITTRTLDEASALGKQMIDEKLATGGTITPTIQSFYRKDDKAYTAPEAMLILKTTNEHLKDIVSQTETTTGAPEIIALSRSLIPS